MEWATITHEAGRHVPLITSARAKRQAEVVVYGRRAWASQLHVTLLARDDRRCIEVCVGPCWVALQGWKISQRRKREEERRCYVMRITLTCRCWHHPLAGYS